MFGARNNNSDLWSTHPVLAHTAHTPVQPEAWMTAFDAPSADPILPISALSVLSASGLLVPSTRLIHDSIGSVLHANSWLGGVCFAIWI